MNLDFYQQKRLQQQQQQFRQQQPRFSQTRQQPQIYQHPGAQQQPQRSQHPGAQQQPQRYRHPGAQQQPQKQQQHGAQQHGAQQQPQIYQHPGVQQHPQRQKQHGAQQQPQRQQQHVAQQQPQRPHQQMRQSSDDVRVLTSSGFLTKQQKIDQQNMQIGRGSTGHVEQNMQVRRGSIGQMEQNMQVRRGSTGQVEKNMQVRSGSDGNFEKNMPIRGRSVVQSTQQIPMRRGSVGQLEQNLLLEGNSFRNMGQTLPIRGLSSQQKINHERNVSQQNNHARNSSQQNNHVVNGSQQTNSMNVSNSPSVYQQNIPVYNQNVDNRGHQGNVSGVSNLPGNNMARGGITDLNRSQLTNSYRMSNIKDPDVVMVETQRGQANMRNISGQMGQIQNRLPTSNITGSRHPLQPIPQPTPRQTTVQSPLSQNNRVQQPPGPVLQAQVQQESVQPTSSSSNSLFEGLSAFEKSFESFLNSKFAPEDEEETSEKENSFNTSRNMSTNYNSSQNTEQNMSESFNISENMSDRLNTPPSMANSLNMVTNHSKSVDIGQNMTNSFNNSSQRMTSGSVMDLNPYNSFNASQTTTPNHLTSVNNSTSQNLSKSIKSKVQNSSSSLNKMSQNNVDQPIKFQQNLSNSSSKTSQNSWNNKIWNANKSSNSSFTTTDSLENSIEYISSTLRSLDNEPQTTLLDEIEIDVNVMSSNSANSSSASGLYVATQHNDSTVNLPKNDKGPEDRPHPCDDCDKRFKSSSNLREHRMSHTGDYPFKCDTCKHGYKRKNKFLNHSCKTKKSSSVCDKCKLEYVKKDEHKCPVTLPDDRSVPKMSSVEFPKNEITNVKTPGSKKGRPIQTEELNFNDSVQLPKNEVYNVKTPGGSKKGRPIKTEEDKFNDWFGPILEQVEIDVPVGPDIGDIVFLGRSWEKTIEVGEMYLFELEDEDFVPELGSTEDFEVEYIDLDVNSVLVDEQVVNNGENILEDGIEVIASTTGLTVEMVREALSGASDFNDNQPNIFPWQSVPSDYENKMQKIKEENALLSRKNAEDEKLLIEKKNNKQIDGTESLRESVSKHEAALNTTLKDFAYFNNELVEDNSGEDSDDDWAESNNKCNECKRQFSSNWHLKQHIKSHKRLKNRNSRKLNNKSMTSDVDNLMETSLDTTLENLEENLEENTSSSKKKTNSMILFSTLR